MASVTKRKKSRFWTACYTDRDGRQLKRSSKTTDRNQALQLAIEWEEVERKARQGVLTTTQLKKVLNDVSEKITGDSLVAPTAKAYFEDWLKGIAARNAPTTHVRYEHCVKLFLDFLGGRAEKPVTTINAKDIEGFLTMRLESGAAPKTAIVDLKTLNTALRRAENYGTILKNPVPAVRLPKAQSSEREVFTHAEVQKLYNLAPTLEWQTLIILGYFIGARLGDCARMKWDNVDPDEGLIIYEQQKTGQKVRVPMHYHVMNHLNLLADYGTVGFLCPKLATKGPAGKHGLSEGFKRIARKAGLDLGEVQGKGNRKFTKRTFHSLRHSFNSALANAGIPEEIRMKLTGHSSKPMHAPYTHLEMGTLEKAVKALPMFANPSAEPTAQ